MNDITDRPALIERDLTADEHADAVAVLDPLYDVVEELYTAADRLRADYPEVADRLDQIALDLDKQHEHLVDAINDWRVQS